MIPHPWLNRPMLMHDVTFTCDELFRSMFLMVSCNAIYLFIIHMMGAKHHWHTMFDDLSILFCTDTICVYMLFVEGAHWIAPNACSLLVVSMAADTEQKGTI